ncbi:hypothetical protein, partial [Streptomyces sp. NPDC050704]|uniref:hypothetical protein n=1 Tax=Streptomyces sp. NPDC050704 TaxID=3157219 RepID=UPI00343B75DD
WKIAPLVRTPFRRSVSGSVPVRSSRPERVMETGVGVARGCTGRRRHRARPDLSSTGRPA